MYKRLLIITGERSGLDSILPAVLKVDKGLYKYINIVSPEYSSIPKRLSSNIKIPSFNGIILNPEISFTYLKTFSEILSFINQDKITDILFVDNPEFNLMLARILYRRHNLYYYIIPQIWAWRRYRIKYLKRYFKKVFVIFPFEKELLNESGIDAEFVGHPRYEEYADDSEYEKEEVVKGNKIITLFPGTRESVLKNHLSLFNDAALLLSEKLKDYKIIVSDIKGRKKIKKGNILFTPESASSLLKISDLAIISSGSTTMEATFAQTPFIGIYKPDIYTYIAAKGLLSINTTLMPNIILKERFVPELVSPYLSHNDIVKATITILNNPEQISIMKRKMGLIKEMFKGYITSDIMKDRIEEILRG